MKNNDIDFNKKQTAGKRRRFVLPLVCVCVVLLGALSFLLIMVKNDFDISKFFGVRDAVEETENVSETENTAESETAEPFSDTESVNVLFYCNDGHDVSFCELVFFSRKENSIRVKPLALDGLYTRDGTQYALKDLFAAFGVSALRTALLEKNFTVDRCVGFSETNFKRVIQNLGEVRVNVPRDVDFGVDAITYSLDSGSQYLKPDVLLQYMKHAFSGDEKLKAEGSAFAEILRTHLTAENVLRGEDFFAGIVNNADTDISMFDYAAYRDSLADFLSSDPSINVIS